MIENFGALRLPPNAPYNTNLQRQFDAITLECYRLAWRVQVTNAPASQLTLSQAVCHYRGG